MTAKGFEGYLVQEEADTDASVKEGAEFFEVVVLRNIAELGRVERKIAELLKRHHDEPWKSYTRAVFEPAAGALLGRFQDLSLEDRSVSGRSKGQVRRAESWLQGVLERLLVSNPSLTEFFFHPEFARVVGEKSRQSISPAEWREVVRGASAVARYVRARAEQEPGIHIGTNAILDASHKIDAVEITLGESEAIEVVLLTQVKAGGTDEAEARSIHATHRNYLDQVSDNLEKINAMLVAETRPSSESGLDSEARRFSNEQLWLFLSELAEERESGAISGYTRELVARCAERNHVPLASFLAILKLPRKQIVRVLNRIDHDLSGRVEALRQWAEEEPMTADEILETHRTYAPRSVLNARSFISRVVAKGAVVSEEAIPFRLSYSIAG